VYLILNVGPRKPYWRERISTVDLLIKIGCFVKKGKIEFQFEKQLRKTSKFKEVNRTDPSPSERLPW
jgi:hypothetical protein